MFVIRNEQIEALQRQLDERFVAQVAEHLRRHKKRSVERFGTVELRRCVRIGLARARSHGLVSGPDLTTFIVLMFFIAPNFDEIEPMRSCLREESLSPGNRLKLLLSRATEEDWKRAARR